MTTASFNSTVLGIETAQIFGSLAAFAAYIFAGRALFTVYSANTNQRYTFKVKAQKGADGKVDHKNGPWWVSARNGKSFQHLGKVKIFKGKPCFFQDDWLKVKGKYVDCLPKRHAARFCFEDLFALIQKGGEMPSGVVIWHHNQCGRCSRALTSDFRHIGYGKTCCGHMGVDHKYIFGLLDEAAHKTDNERVVMMRDLVYKGLTSDDGMFAKLLPGMAGEYGRSHLRCRRAS